MNSKELCNMYNSLPDKERMGLVMNYLPEKNPNAATRYFEIMHGDSKEIIIRMFIERLRTKRTNITMHMGTNEEIKVKFIWEKGKVKCYENQGTDTYQDNTYAKMKEWMLNTSIFNEIFMKLNKVTWADLHDNINPVLKDFEFKKNVPYENFSLYEELRFENMTEFFDNYNIKSPRLKALIREQAKDIDKLIKLCKLFEFFLKAEVDINFMLNYFDTLVKITEHKGANGDFTKLKFVNKDNFRRFCLDCENALSTNKVGEFYAAVNDIDKLQTQLLELNKDAVLPKVENFVAYHHAISNLVVDEQTKLESKPYTWTEDEKRLNGTEVDGYTIKLPVSKPDLRMWGRIQGHCIGTYDFQQNQKLISFWKENGTVINSCLEIRRDGNSYPFRERQHRGRHNGDPNIPSEISRKLYEEVWACYNPAPEPKELDPGYKVWKEKKDAREEAYQARVKAAEEAKAKEAA